MLRLICFWCLMLLLPGCGTTETPSRQNDITPLTSIEIVAVTPIAAKTSTTLKVMGHFSGQFSRDVTDQVVWSSNKPTVAEFITAGQPNRVTGHIPETALLTATVGKLTAAVNFTVTPAIISTMTITPATPSVSKGLDTQLKVTGTFSDNTTQDLTFDAVWASGDPTFATVSDDPGSKGLVHGVTAGTSNITAIFDGKVGTESLTVTEAKLQSIEVTPGGATVLSLSSASFEAFGTYSDGTRSNITARANWASSQTGVAAIASPGTAKTTQQGTTTLSAILDGVTGKATLKVTGGSLTGITVSPFVSPFTLAKDTVAFIKATGSFGNGITRDITGLVDWSVDNGLVAEITKPGANQVMVKALTTATTIITAKSGSVTGTANLNVTAPNGVQSIVISPANLALIAGTSGQLLVTATFTDATTQDVTASADWSSNLVTAATVDNVGQSKGRIRGVASVAGSVIITADYGGKTSTAQITIANPTVTTLTIPDVGVIAAGNQVKFTAQATLSNNSTLDVTRDVNWSINNSNIAVLAADSQNKPGEVVGIDIGIANITASFPGATTVTKTLLITVQ